MRKKIKNLFRKFGYEYHKYHPALSSHALLRQILQANQIDLIVDVGANSGQFGEEVMSTGYLGRIISFEPISSVFQALQKKASAYKNWNCVHCAIGNTNGEITINVSENSLSSSVLPIEQTHVQAAPDSAYARQEKVPVKKLADALPPALTEQYRAILLKVDVQGFEWAVIEGALDFLPHVKLLQLELSFVPLYQGGILYQDMINRVERLGFVLFTLIPEFRDPQTGRLFQADGLFINQKYDTLER